MKIILLEKFKNLGDKGDVLFVKSGYARNFLIPYGKAVLATENNIRIEENKKIKFEQELMKKTLFAKEKIDKIKQIKSITLLAKSGLEGKLFGSIGPRDIAKKLSELSGIKISKNEIFCLDGIFRSVGKHEIKFQPHHDMSIQIEVNIISQTK